jgi:hypothetical protein
LPYLAHQSAEDDVRIYGYAWSSAPITPQTYSNKQGGFPLKLTSAIFGNLLYVFDPLLTKVKTGSPGGWVDVPGVTFTYPTDLTLVRGYRLSFQSFVLSLLTDSAAKGGELYIAINTVLSPKIEWTSATTVAYRDFTDEVNNFLRWEMIILYG